MKWVRVALHWEPLFCFSDLWVPLARLGSEGGLCGHMGRGEQEDPGPSPNAQRCKPRPPSQGAPLPIRGTGRLLGSLLLRVSWVDMAVKPDGGGLGGQHASSPGNLVERRGQAGQVEGPGAAVAADELAPVPAHGTLVLVLLTRARHTRPLEDPGTGRCPPREPLSTAPPQRSPGTPKSSACSLGAGA